MRIPLIVTFLLLSLAATSQFDNCYYIRLWRITNAANPFDPPDKEITQLLDLEKAYNGATADHYYTLYKLFLQQLDTPQSISYLHKYFYAGGVLDTGSYELVIAPGIRDWYAENILPGRNQQLIEKLQVIVDSDQAARRSHASDRAMFLHHLGTVDSANAIGFIEIIQQYGFPKVKETGDALMAKLFPLFLHLIFYDSKYHFSSYLEKAIFTGDFTPAYYCNIVDRYYLQAKKEGRLYGCYALSGPIENFTSDSVIDASHLDERRISIGLPPINELPASITKIDSPFNGYKPLDSLVCH